MTAVGEKGNDAPERPTLECTTANRKVFAPIFFSHNISVIE
jgi:hypothetical protein